MDKNSGRQKVYLAGPLFSEAERSFNARLKLVLEQYVDVYLPQEDGGLLVEMVASGTPVELARQTVFRGDMKAIQDCHALVIILDGRAIDEGAAFELGCAYTLGKPCYGLKTDPRQLLPYTDNPMIRAPLREVFGNVPELVSWARAFTRADSEVKAFAHV